MKNIVIIGGSGLVGQHLSQKLSGLGYHISIYGRTQKQESQYSFYTYNYRSNQIETEGLEQANFVINLAGANVGSKRWTKKRKQEIYDSRVKQTGFFFRKIKEFNPNIKAYISASAIGYYGMQISETIHQETDKAGKDFLAEVCRDWEEKADLFQQAGIRTIKFRTGLVLSARGGAIARMRSPAKLGLLSPLGSGKQYMPWIHIEDLCRLFIKAIENTKLHGVYNAVAPEHINNKGFTKHLLQQYKKRMWLPKVPSFVLKTVLGEQAKLLLHGNRVSSGKIQKTKFEFKFPEIEPALKNILT